MIRTRLYIFTLLTSLLATACATGDRKETSADAGLTSDSTNTESLLSGRIALVSIQADDSASLATPQVVDGMLAQAFDSLEEVDYLRLGETGLAGKSGAELDSITGGLNLDGAIALRIARLGSVVGVDLRVVDPASGKVLHHDRAFSFIRYREEDGTLLFGPALYEALYRHVLRIGQRPVGAMPDGRVIVADALPLVIGSVEIPRDSTLGRIFENRVDISRDGVRALGDFVRYRFNAFVVFDVESRTRLYELVGLGLVEDLAPVGDLERKAMFNVDIPYFLATAIRPAGGDSVEISAVLHQVTGPDSDRPVDSAARRYESGLFQTSTTTRDAIAELLSVSEDLLRSTAEKIRGHSGPVE